MDRKEVNRRIYHLSQRVLDGRVLELTMRSMTEKEKNIWRLDYALLREEIKSSYFYAPELSHAFLNSLQGRQQLSEQVRCQLILGLVIRNPHWAIVEEEFFRLYGALQIEVKLLFADYSLLRFFHHFQHRGITCPDELASCLESLKSLETKQILDFYQPSAWRDLVEGKKTIQVEKYRIKRIQEVMVDETSIVAGWIETALMEDYEQADETVNQWRVKMDQLQRRERKGATDAEMRKAKVGQRISHRYLGPMRVLSITQGSDQETLELQGPLRHYDFRYEKKR